MRYIVAVSGGVDSVVLLNMLVRAGTHELVVAHFDHGMRDDSHDDAQFVKALAKMYGLAFVERREELGAASEALARTRRYAFLREVAKKEKATIVTAHHADDLIETIAINIARGTGWRGVAVLGAADVVRPLLHMRKQTLYRYAIEHRLEWVEDVTNRDNRYLRNRLRMRTKKLPNETRQKLMELWGEQTTLKAAIEEEVGTLVERTDVLSRYFFSMIPDDAALELLRYVVASNTAKTLLSPQLLRGILAIKAAHPGTIMELGEEVYLSFTKTTFVARRGEKVL